MAFICPDSI